MNTMNNKTENLQKFAINLESKIAYDVALLEE